MSTWPCSVRFSGICARSLGGIDGRHVVGRAEDGPRNFDLHLVGDAALGIGPVVRHDEPAGRCRRHQRPRDIDRRQARPAPPSRDRRSLRSSDSRATGQLADRAERESLPTRCEPSRRTARLSAKFGPLTAISTGVGEPKLITSLTMSDGSNEKRTSGIACDSRLPQSLLQAPRR